MTNDILPTFDEICESILDLQPIPDTELPSECVINMDAVCSVALQQSPEDCLACFLTNEDLLSRVGCDEVAARSYCQQELYSCKSGECVLSSDGTGLPLDTCLEFCEDA